MHKLIRSILIAFLFFLISSKIAAQDTGDTGKVSKDTLTSADSSIIKTKAPSSPKEIVIKYGIASFYAKKFNGRKTATGDIFSSSKLTAACNVLPLRTWVKVTNTKNDKSVIVYINDRLHHKNKRLIDLSRSAAENLGFVSKGLTKVKVEVLGKLRRK